VEGACCAYKRYYIWSIFEFGGENHTLRKVDKKSNESFETWCWRRMEIIATDRVRNTEVKEERDILYEMKRMKDN
jgi:hypothetical protein